MNTRRDIFLRRRRDQITNGRDLTPFPFYVECICRACCATETITWRDLRVKFHEWNPYAAVAHLSCEDLMHVANTEGLVAQCLECYMSGDLIIVLFELPLLKDIIREIVLLLSLVRLM